jgi:hypothetical protein
MRCRLSWCSPRLGAHRFRSHLGRLAEDPRQRIRVEYMGLGAQRRTSTTSPQRYWPAWRRLVALSIGHVDPDLAY